MRARLMWMSLGGSALLSACGSGDRAIDPVEGISIVRQQTISRARLGFRWPLTPGAGTLACAEDGAILFRAGGVTYLVNGHRPGAADIAPLRLAEPSPPPSNPVKRLKQNVRMDAFASMKQCEATGRQEACSRGVQQRFALTADEARLIEAEGRERRWPPLARGLMPLEPLVEAGRALCNR